MSRFKNHARNAYATIPQLMSCFLLQPSSAQLNSCTLIQTSNKDASSLPHTHTHTGVASSLKKNNKHKKWAHKTTPQPQTRQQKREKNAKVKRQQQLFFFLLLFTLQDVWQNLRTRRHEQDTSTHARMWHVLRAMYKDPLFKSITREYNE